MNIELIKQQQKFIKMYILHKMYPSICTDKIQVFEDREEYNKFINLHFKIDRLLEKE